MGDVEAAMLLALRHGYGQITVKVQDHKVVDVKVLFDYNIAKGERVQLPVR